MNTLIEKYISKGTYEKEVECLKGNQEFEEVFVSYLEEHLTRWENEDLIEEDDTEAVLLDLPLRYIKNYSQSRQQGFSKVWSDCYAESKARDMNNDYLLDDCYLKVEKECKDTAVKDLHVFCEMKGADNLYTEHLIYIMTNSDWYGQNLTEKRAADYSRLYREESEKGKSEIYVHQFAALMAAGYYSRSYCKNYSLIYAQCIDSGKSDADADEEAHKYANKQLS